MTHARGPVDPRLHKPAERVAVKGMRYGERFVEFATRHGTRTRIVARKDYGATVGGAMTAFTDEMEWLESGTLPTENYGH